MFFRSWKRHNINSYYDTSLFIHFIQKMPYILTKKKWRLITLLSISAFSRLIQCWLPFGS